jgi:glycosyltransferase involved in cell wall biosynthesis
MLLENNSYPVDVRVRNEAEALVAAGHAVTVVAPRGEGEPRREVVHGVRVERFWLPRTPDSPPGFLLEYAIAHAQLLARALRHLLRGADVVHLHNPPDTLFPAALMARALGAAAVFDHHDLSPELFEDKFGPGGAMRVLRAAQRASVRAADLVVATNDSQREVLEGLASGSRPVVVVRNGPRAGTLQDAGEARGGSLVDPHVVFLGTLAAQDGVADLPPLIAALRGRHALAGARMTVVGDGPSRGELESEFRRAQVSDAVEMTGWVPHARVPEILATADVCVDPAGCTPLNHRSTMIKIAEYLAAARPVVAYELLETRRTAGEAALYAGCGDREGLAGLVARLAADAGLRAELAGRARQRAPELVWERSEQRLIDAYAALGERRGSG